MSGKKKNDSDFTPIPITKGAQRSRDIDTMANRIVSTYLAANRAEHHKGETFYSQEAHGTARALAAGFDPDSDMGKMLRTMPSPGGRQSEWQQGISTHNVGQLYGHRARFEGKVRQAAGVLARLSPQTSWERNVAQAHEVYGLADETVAGLFHDKREPLQKGGRRGGPMQLNKQPSQNITRAHGIAKGKTALEDEIPTGKQRVKVGSFFENIAEPDTSPHTTVDYRAHDIAAGQLLATSANRELRNKSRYGMFEEAHERAADTINDKYPDRRQQSAPIQPKQVQATVWWADRNAQDAKMNAAKGGHLHAGEGGKALTRGDLGKPAGQ